MMIKTKEELLNVLVSVGVRMVSYTAVAMVGHKVANTMMHNAVETEEKIFTLEDELIELKKNKIKMEIEKLKNK